MLHKSNLRTIIQFSNHYFIKIKQLQYQFTNKKMREDNVTFVSSYEKSNNFIMVY